MQSKIDKELKEDLIKEIYINGLDVINGFDITNKNKTLIKQ